MNEEKTSGRKHTRSSTLRLAVILALIVIAAYLADPNAWLAEKTGDAAAKSKMTFKLQEGGADIAAYLATLK